MCGEDSTARRVDPSVVSVRPLQLASSQSDAASEHCSTSTGTGAGTRTTVVLVLVVLQYHFVGSTGLLNKYLHIISCSQDVGTREPGKRYETVRRGECLRILVFLSQK